MTNAISFLYLFSFGTRGIETNELCIQTMQLTTTGVLVQQLLDYATVYICIVTATNNLLRQMCRFLYRYELISLADRRHNFPAT